MVIKTGYDEVDKEDEKEKAPPPGDRTWSIEIDKVGRNVDDEEIIFVTILADEEIMGMLRLPNNEYLTWLRERLNYVPSR